MTRIIADISLPLDGIVTEPAPGQDRGGIAVLGRPHPRSATHAGTAERDPGIDREASDVRSVRVSR